MSRYACSIMVADWIAGHDEARWIIANGKTAAREVPSFRNFTYADGLAAVKPEAVTIIR